jgi:hypothetical protein
VGGDSRGGENFAAPDGCFAPGFYARRFINSYKKVRSDTGAVLLTASVTLQILLATMMINSELPGQFFPR